SFFNCPSVVCGRLVVDDYLEPMMFFIASIAMISMLNIRHIDASTIYAALGFDNALRTAITLSFIIYCTVFLAFCIFTIIALVSFIIRVEKLRKEDEDKAKSSLSLMRAIRADMIELKTQKFNEERNREEAAVAAKSDQRLQSSTEEPINLSRECRTLKGIEHVVRKVSRESERRELIPSHPEKKIALQQRQQHSLSPDLKTSRERTSSDVRRAKLRKESDRAGEILKRSSQGSIKPTLVIQATQSFGSTRSTQRSFIQSVRKKASVVPGIIRTSTSTLMPPKMKPSRKTRKCATAKAKKHKKISKKPTCPAEETEETIQSTKKTIVPPLQQVRSSTRSVVAHSPLSIQKTMTSMQLSVQNMIRPNAPQLTLIQKPTDPKALLAPAQSTTTHQALPTQLSVQRTIRSAASRTPSSQQRAMRSPASTQLSAQKTLFSAAPTQLSFQKTIYPTGSCRLPVQSREQTNAIDEKKKANELSVVRTQRDQYEDNSLLTFSDNSEKAILPPCSIIQAPSTIKSLGQHREVYYIKTFSIVGSTCTKFSEECIDAIATFFFKAWPRLSEDSFETFIRKIWSRLSEDFFKTSIRKIWFPLSEDSFETSIRKIWSRVSEGSFKTISTIVTETWC
uniref:C2H2-type domain-containing protein n=1 Tax=Parascaris univalens TaxID=6257 RepID=A0A915BWP3_PARUN